MYCSLVGLLYSTYPPQRLVVPTLADRYPHVDNDKHNDARDPSSERWNYVGENLPVILPEIATSTSTQGSFTCRKSATRDPRLYFPSEGRCAEDFFRPEKSWRLRPGLNPRTWVVKGNTLPLEHRNRFTAPLTQGSRNTGWQTSNWFSNKDIQRGKFFKRPRLFQSPVLRLLVSTVELSLWRVLVLTGWISR